MLVSSLMIAAAAPAATYAVQSSTNLVTDSFSATVESGIPALTTTNSITIEIPEDPAVF